MNEIGNFVENEILFNGNSLVIYNANLNLSGLEKIFSSTKYHLIFSHSINHTLDFIKLYGNNEINFKLLKIIVIKNELHGIKEIAFAFENLIVKK